MNPVFSAWIPLPDIQLLSNGHYHLMLTAGGGGYSRWNNIALTRWRSDTTRDNWGAFCYIRDTQTGDVWSNTWQPTGYTADKTRKCCSPMRAEFDAPSGDSASKLRL
jgi:cellobiose phosphorylase